ncbi:DNA-protecting protein DprA [Microbacterium radiodurans]|uniref:DNA-protecting protein DprA n=2 Tax=Microbacterium radiodurans TaxID=661398 RepID=A0A5J5IUP7_9MICO|nr:DNA-protecting protein DprA [Microbacterium radiodurans]
MGAEEAWAIAVATDPTGASARVAAAGIDPLDLVRAHARWKPRLPDAEPSVTLARRIGARLLVPGDPEWPARADDLGVHAPVALWVRGDVGVLASDAPAIAVVGARAATAYGTHAAAEIAGELASAGAAIVSGAAFGIDAAAHRAAVAVGGRGIAVLAGGVDKAYPAAHGELLGRIARSGAVISEVACGTAPTKWRFLQRNRLIAALSDATVVVEAGWRSGSLNTAGHAAALGRPLGAVPGPITSAASAGCHRVLREYDGSCITCADDVRELIGWSSSDAAATALSSGQADRTDDRTRVLDALSTRSPRSVAEVARRAGMSEQDALAHVALLDLDGRARRDDRGWRRV